MVFLDLTDSDKELIRELYLDNNISKESAQRTLSEKFNTSERTIRNWANNLDLNLLKENIIDQAKIMVYDIETSRAEGKFWWTGKTYINHTQITKLPSIISIAWKWLGSSEIYSDHWNMQTHSDKELLENFLIEYNSADMVIGQNNDKFDNRWINAMAAKYNFDVNIYVKSFDLMKQTKKLFRLPSYSMAFVANFFDVTHKQSHDGIVMWNMVEDGNNIEQREYMDKMVEYNKGDIVSTEEIYLKLRKYMGHKMHIGVLEGGEKYSCPNCGRLDIELERTTTTVAGTIQRIMKCNNDKVTFKLNNTQYLKFLDL